MLFENMDRIVFAGDSVTDMGSAQPVGEGLFENVGHSYVRIVENMLSTWYPEIKVRVTNSGISGNTSRNLRGRFKRDVIDLNPEDWMRKRMDEYGAICKKLAEKHGCIFVDLQETFNRYFKYRHSTYIAWDRVHPNLIGATIIAKEFLRHCEFDYDHLPG